MGSGWGSELGLRPGAPRRMERRDDPGEWGGEEAGRWTVWAFSQNWTYIQDQRTRWLDGITD